MLLYELKKERGEARGAQKSIRQFLLIIFVWGFEKISNQFEGVSSVDLLRCYQIVVKTRMYIIIQQKKWSYCHTSTYFQIGSY